jgi:hypothetical protein
MPWTGYRGDFGGRLAAQAGMRSGGVVVLFPGCEFNAGVQWLKGHSNIVQAVLHEKSFATRSTDEAANKSDAA